MVLTKLLFIILIIVCALFYILYIWDFALVLLIVMIAVPIIMFVSTLITKHCIKVEFAVKEKNTVKSKDFPVQLVVTNKSIFPIGKAEAKVEYYNSFSHDISSFDLFLPIQSRNSQRVTFQLNSKFCGTIKIRTLYLNIYDPLRIFKFKAASSVHSEVTIMPEGHDIGGIVHYSDRVNEESDLFSEHRPGDDPSEVFDLREYNAGDKLNRIHWKLSSKKDEFIVKDYSLPIDVPCMLFLDLKCYSEGAAALPVTDTLIETFLSISQFLLDNERCHSVVFFNALQNRFAEYSITSSTDLAAVVKTIINSVDDTRYCQDPDVYFKENDSLSFASFTYISSDFNEKLLDSIDEEVDADFKNAVMIIDDIEKTASLSGGYSSLNVIPVVVGRISASIKDIDI
ncbi:DUF58 domain-containing protein [Ruminococcus sp.]|uniref:DUF58 domain-containing protein n=1 Tax=Ruminococcus sp. TaxID=41978 RepID=UPI0025EB3479|nr:DUF58 domain-containing protein [Ruminococcus sp.]MCR4637809.1 DUF58 domain-containing protein [Ruminococcus sp.]